MTRQDSYRVPPSNTGIGEIGREISLMDDESSVPLAKHQHSHSYSAWKHITPSYTKTVIAYPR